MSKYLSRIHSCCAFHWKIRWQYSTRQIVIFFFQQKYSIRHSKYTFVLYKSRMTWFRDLRIITHFFFPPKTSFVFFIISPATSIQFISHIKLNSRSQSIIIKSPYFPSKKKKLPLANTLTRERERESWRRRDALSSAAKTRRRRRLIYMYNMESAFAFVLGFAHESIKTGSARPFGDFDSWFSSRKEGIEQGFSRADAPFFLSFTHVITFLFVC